MKSKGKYLIFLDPDDLISKNILVTCYKLAEKYKYEIIRFNIYEGFGKINLDKFINELTNCLRYFYLNNFYIKDS